MFTWILLLSTAVGYSPGEFARARNTLLNELSGAPRDRNQSAETRETRTRKLNDSFVALLDKARTLNIGDLTDEDLIALADTATHLRRHREAVDFARRAVQREQSADAYITLIRCLTETESMDEAERAAAAGAKLFFDDDKCYLMPYVIAARYRSRCQMDKYHQFIEQALESLFHDCLRGTAHAELMQRTVAEFIDASGIVGQRDRSAARINEWCVRTRKVLDEQVSKCREEGKALTGNPERTLAIRHLYQALVAMRCVESPQCIEEVGSEWCGFLMDCSSREADGVTWLDEVRVFAQQMAWANSTAVNCSVLRKQIRSLSVKVGEAVRNSDVPHDRVAVALQELTRLDGILDQQNRLRERVGDEIVSQEEFLDLTDGARPDLLLVHVFDPRSKECQKGFQALQWVHSGPLARHDVQLSLCAPQSGLHFAGSDGTIARSPVTSVAEERSALLKLTDVVHAPSSIHLLPTSCLALNGLSVKFLPLNLVLDSERRLLCASVGMEKERVTRLLRFAIDHQKAFAVTDSALQNHDESGQ